MKPAKEIAEIKAYRAATGCTLRESIDAIANGQKVPASPETAAPASEPNSFDLRATNATIYALDDSGANLFSATIGNNNGHHMPCEWIAGEIVRRWHRAGASPASEPNAQPATESDGDVVLPEQLSKKVRLEAATASDGMCSIEAACRRSASHGMEDGAFIERALWELAAAGQEIEAASPSPAQPTIELPPLNGWDASSFGPNEKVISVAGAQAYATEAVRLATQRDTGAIDALRCGLPALTDDMLRYAMSAIGIGSPRDAERFRLFWRFADEAYRTAAPSIAPNAPKDGSVIAEIAAERQRQINVEGWTPEHDDEHTGAEMARAAACYALKASGAEGGWMQFWPWAIEWWKPGLARRMLIKAAALIVAEIERLDRATPATDQADAMESI